ncbi:ABC transporter substrate-binding protein [Pusillimonas sp. CC-YST705]|uniref:ABC transporter substrate-binding protein n=1 Tax=Mesopusillimonas faecipullorum TaxID=2755040 RepID=A0ABS8CED1_9BURK|nr:ABC transporter substrate-binding protein [Mesopusillimonas faecipullorum]MCB5364394.1 ABC transporter substrate-binding protein [Mesopusillimonas faecipullorum]
MRRNLSLTAAAIYFCTSTIAHADVVFGVIAPMTGQFASVGQAWKQSIDLYLQANGDTLEGQKVRVIYRDLPDPNPPKARALAQELIVKEKADILGGFMYTPNATAAANIATQSKSPLIVFNAAGAGLTERSPYLTRVSYTQAQLTLPMADYAIKSGMKRIATIVSDYSSGIDAERTFVERFKAQGGEITNSIRVPLDNFDFAPFMQTIRAEKPDAVLSFTPGGVISIGLVKSFKANGLEDQGIKLLTLGSEVDDTSTLPALGSQALGVYSSNFYNPTLDTQVNRDFRQAFTQAYPKSEIGVVHVQAWDAMELVRRMIEAAPEKFDGKKAIDSIKGYEWESPRGPIQIDAETRDILQRAYIRQVTDIDSKMVNHGIDQFEAVR